MYWILDALNVSTQSNGLIDILMNLALLGPGT